MKMKFLLMAVLLSFSNFSHAQSDEFPIVEDTVESSDEIYIPEEEEVVSDEPVILDESDSQQVEGASEYDY